MEYDKSEIQPLAPSDESWNPPPAELQLIREKRPKRVRNTSDREELFEKQDGSYESQQYTQIEDYDKTEAEPKYNSKVQIVQAQVDELVEIARNNVIKIYDRGGKLDDLEESAVKLNIEAEKFQKTSVVVNRKFRNKNLKMTVIFAVLIIFLISVVMGFLVYAASNET